MSLICRSADCCCPRCLDQYYFAEARAPARPAPVSRRPSHPTRTIGSLPLHCPTHDHANDNSTKTDEFHRVPLPRNETAGSCQFRVGSQGYPLHFTAAARVRVPLDFFLLSETKHWATHYAFNIRDPEIAGELYGERLMVASEVFIRHAAECEYMAKRSRDPQSREVWRRMAERWIRCAELAEHQSQPSAKTRPYGKPAHA